MERTAKVFFSVVAKKPASHLPPQTQYIFHSVFVNKLFRVEGAPPQPVNWRYFEIRTNEEVSAGSAVPG